MPNRLRSRSVVFTAVVVISLAGAVGYVASAAKRGSSSSSDEASGGASAIRGGPHVIFQNVRGRAGDDVYAHVALAAADRPAARRVTTRLVCERIYYAANRGLCLTSRQGLLERGYDITITDRDFKPRRELRLPGIPSRARISPDGRYGATTGFVSGHSYADANFSTKTVLIDMARGEVLADLERDFTITRDGKRIKDIDFNFWGVTFAGERGRFYATLRTREKTYLLEGDVGSRRARVVYENVECPSISPDFTRLAYKKWLGDRWRLQVLDLATMEETPAAETRSIDDQVEWLDERNLLYGLSPDIWTVPADGSGTPRKFLTRALSPAVVRN